MCYLISSQQSNWDQDFLCSSFFLLVDARCKCRYASALGLIANRPLSHAPLARVGKMLLHVGFTVQISLSKFRKSLRL